jgi:metal-responsive CopG/Arc/MetJ family transcriptional regulator
LKTAVSIPDRLFEAAERLAKRLSMSRSELYSEAVANYLTINRSLEVRKRLDIVYDAESSRLDDDVASLQFESIPKEKW